ncbi:MAG: pyridoxal 5'-phosphate synthase glutaminase subunit PdxT [bacterium]
MGLTVGVLGLQGDFALHRESLKRIGIGSKIVRWPEELQDCGGLILPGGESTTFVKLLKKTGLFDGIRTFAKDRGVMGTCAGLITLSTKLLNDSMETLGLIDMEVERNGYGRQVDSFVDKVRISVFQEKPDFEGIFIRAPRIRLVGKGTEALGFHGDEIVMAKNDRVLVTTFHPELTKDGRVHRYFVESFLKQV